MAIHSNILLSKIIANTEVFNSLGSRLWSLYVYYHYYFKGFVKNTAFQERGQKEELLEKSSLVCSTSPRSAELAFYTHLNDILLDVL